MIEQIHGSHTRLPLEICTIVLRGLKMSRLIFDRKDNGPLQYVDDNEWTTDRFKDELFLSLTRNTRYYLQAKNLMYRIPLTAQNPKSEKEALPFTINFNDLSSRVQDKFIEYCQLYPSGNVTVLLKEIVIRLFENLDFEYAHMSVMKKLRVKIDGI